MQTYQAVVTIPALNISVNLTLEGVQETPVMNVHTTTTTTGNYNKTLQRPAVADKLEEEPVTIYPTAKNGLIRAKEVILSDGRKFATVRALAAYWKVSTQTIYQAIHNKRKINGVNVKYTGYKTFNYQVRSKKSGKVYQNACVAYKAEGLSLGSGLKTEICEKAYVV